MNKKLITIILFLYLVLYNVDTCQPLYQLQNLQTGIVNFQNTFNTNQIPSQQIYTYNYFTKFYQTPQIAFAINNIQNSNIQLPSFYIITSNINVSSTTFLLNNYQQWNLITINFIISLRNDLYINSNQLNLTTSVNSKSFQLSILKNIDPYKSVAKVFLNGFLFKQPMKYPVIQSILLSINVQINLLTQKSIILSINGSSLSIINALWFSFIIFEPQTSGFISYGGKIQKQFFQGIQSSNLHKIIYRSQYKLFGINSLQLNSSISSIGLISSVSSDFIGTIYSNSLINKIKIDYVFFGIPPYRMCNCQNQTLKFIYEDSCLSKCPQNTYVYKYQDGSYSCLKCSQSLNLKLNTNRTGCQCNDGYQFNSQKTQCIIPSFQIVNNKIQLKILDSSSLQINQFSQSNNNLNKSTSTTILNKQKKQIIPNVKISNSCLLNIPNSYFDGTYCYCKTGFKNVSNSCILITQINLQLKQFVPIPLQYLTNQTYNFTCSSQFQIQINGKCQCIYGYQRLNQICISKSSSKCGTGQYFNGSSCICLNGYIRISNNLCQLSNNQYLNCSDNQVNNGLGQCVCKIGYYSINGKCINEKPCPLNSYKNSNGTCVCNNNFFNINGECSRCLQRQLWLPTQSKCVYFCGQNSIYNQNKSQCQCINNFGIFRQNVCQYCSPQKTIINNYCVSCTVNQYYDSQLRKCVCEQQFYLQKNGICYPKCSNNEYFDKATLTCKCRQTLGRFNNLCQICPVNYEVNQYSQQCVPCRQNQIFVDRKCICKSQFALTIFKTCVPCGSVPNTFMFNGKCATCPGQKVYNGITCVCPVGTKQFGLKCIQSCKNDQILDQVGNCYQCPINQIVVNNQCVCRKNYQRIDGVCQLACPLGTFAYKGRCALCPRNKVFNAQINGCVCQNGYYLNNYNQCQKLNINLIQCPLGKYLDPDFGCQDCSPYCLNCTNSNTCLNCQSSYLLLNGRCQDFCGNGLISYIQQCDDQNIINGDGCSSTCRIEADYKCSGIPSVCISLLPQIKCGNGIIQTNEQCDDFNTLSGDGCSQKCVIQRLFDCYGQPSTCKYNATWHACGNGYVEYSQQCDDANFNNADGCNQNCLTQPGYVCINQPSICSLSSLPELKLFGEIKYNINNIYISLQTKQKYEFKSQWQGQNFIKSSYTSTQKPSTYCLQRQYPQLDIFDCLILYSSGIPNRLFKGQFSYTKPQDKSTVKLVVDIDPLASQADVTKNLRRK